MARNQGDPLIERAVLFSGKGHDLHARLSKQGTLKPVRLPALIPHHQVHGLPGLYVNPIRRESKIVNDDVYFLILGGTGPKTEHEDRQAFDRSPAPC